MAILTGPEALAPELDESDFPGALQPVASRTPPRASAPVASARREIACHIALPSPSPSRQRCLRGVSRAGLLPAAPDRSGGGGSVWCAPYPVTGCRNVS